MHVTIVVVAVVIVLSVAVKITVGALCLRPAIKLSASTVLFSPKVCDIKLITLSPLLRAS